MSVQSSSLTHRIASIASKLGLARKPGNPLQDRAASLQLPFAELPPVPDSIWWQGVPPIHRLAELPRDALSGPVQEDKAEARSVLRGVVSMEESDVENFDLRSVTGLALAADPEHHYPSFEAYAASPACRGIRLISYKDFSQALARALPGDNSAMVINLRKANWRSNHLFYAPTTPQEAPARYFACAIAYARVRGLNLPFTARIADYSLSRAGLRHLEHQYHVLAMPTVTWSDPHFMQLLLTGMPYARLTLLRGPGAPEFLLLPRQHADSNALGEGLRLAGAPDVCHWLKHMLPA